MDIPITVYSYDKQELCRIIKEKIHNNQSNITQHHYATIFSSRDDGSWYNKIAFGINSNISFQYMPSRHAEMDALNKIKRKRELPRYVDMFVIRISKNGSLGESRPCIHCIQMLEKSRLTIKHIYYSTNNGTIVREKFNNMKNSNIIHISSGMRTINRYRKYCQINKQI